MQHFIKKAAALVLAMVMVLSLANMALAADFEDMPTDWSADAVQSAVANGLLSGKDGKIAASDNLTRAEMATIITRAFGAEVKDNISFTDVASDAWYADYVAQAAHMGVMNGSNGKFNPAANITRQEVFTVLARALKLADGSAEDLAVFSDGDKVASWAVPTVSALVKAGYVSGSNGALNPAANITRAEFAQVMYNIFNNAYLNQAGTYEEVDGKNVIISSSNVTVKGVEIEGDVVIADGVGDGDVFLEDVAIGGRVVVRGGGMNSVHFRGSKAGSVIVTKVDGNVRVVFDEESTVETVSVEGGKASTDVRIEGAVKNVVVNDATSTVVLADAKVEKLDVAAADAKISLAGATVVAEMTVAEGATNTTMIAEKTAEITKLTTAEDVFIDNTDVIKESNDDEKINPEKPAESGAPEASSAPSGGGAIEPDDPSKPLGKDPVEKPSDNPAPPATADPVDTTPPDNSDAPVTDDPNKPQDHTEHTFDGTVEANVTVVTPATCTEQGEIRIKCTGCAATTVHKTAALGHTTPGVDATTTVAATCSSTGYKSWKCDRCNAIVKTETLAKVAHTDGGYVITQENHYRQCAKCGMKIEVAENGTVTEAVDQAAAVAAHSFVYSQPGNVSAEYHQAKCSACGYSKNEKHDATGVDTWQKDATSHWKICKETGCNGIVGKAAHTLEVNTTNNTHVCSVCSYVDDTAHRYTIAGTGPNAGKMVCACGAVEPCEHEKAANDEGTQKSAATCKAAKVMTYTCTKCGQKFDVSVGNPDAEAHVTTKNETGYDNTKHWTKCDLDASHHVDEENHSWAPKESANAKCTGCDYVCTHEGVAANTECPTCHVTTPAGGAGT